MTGGTEAAITAIAAACVESHSAMPARNADHSLDERRVIDEVSMTHRSPIHDRGVRPSDA